MNVAPITSLPASARTADMPSGQGSGFGDLLSAALSPAPAPAPGSTNGASAETTATGSAVPPGQGIAADDHPAEPSQPGVPLPQLAAADSLPGSSDIAASNPPDGPVAAQPTPSTVAASVAPAVPSAEPASAPVTGSPAQAPSSPPGAAIVDPVPTEPQPISVATASPHASQPDPAVVATAKAAVPPVEPSPVSDAADAPPSPDQSPDPAVIAPAPAELPGQGAAPGKPAPSSLTAKPAIPPQAAGPSGARIAANQVAIPPQAKQPDAGEETDGPGAPKGTDRKKEGAAKTASAPTKSAPADLPFPPADGAQSAIASTAPIIAQAAVHATNRNGDAATQSEPARGDITRVGPPSADPTAKGDGVETGAMSPQTAHDNLPSLLTSQISAAPIGRAALPAQAYAAPASSPSLSAAQQPVIAAQAGRIGRDMGVEIARQVASGRSEVLIRLDPADMGRIDVRLSFDAKGSLHAAMSTDSPAALDLLRRDAGDLSRALADAGIRSDASSFRFDSRSSDGGQFAQNQGQSGGDARDQRGGGSSHHGGRDDADTGGAAPLYRQLRASGRIDLMA